jgi:uncharacterized membrane protein
MALFQVHAVLMAAGFLCFVAAAFVAATKRSQKWWLRVHRVAGLSGTVLMLCGAAMAAAAIILSGESHFRTPHSWIGALTVAGAVAAPVLGFLQFRIRNRLQTVRAAHRWCGRLLTASALIAILLGLRLAGLI